MRMDEIYSKVSNDAAPNISRLVHSQYSLVMGARNELAEMDPESQTITCVRNRCFCRFRIAFSGPVDRVRVSFREKCSLSTLEEIRHSAISSFLLYFIFFALQ